MYKPNIYTEHILTFSPFQNQTKRRLNTMEACRWARWCPTTPSRCWCRPGRGPRPPAVWRCPAWRGAGAASASPSATGAGTRTRSAEEPPSPSAPHPPLCRCPGAAGSTRPARTPGRCPRPPRSRPPRPRTTTSGRSASGAPPDRVSRVSHAGPVQLSSITNHTVTAITDDVLSNQPLSLPLGLGLVRGPGGCCVTTWGAGRPPPRPPRPRRRGRGPSAPPPAPRTTGSSCPTRSPTSGPLVFQ